MTTNILGEVRKWEEVPYTIHTDCAGKSVAILSSIRLYSDKEIARFYNGMEVNGLGVKYEFRGNPIYVCPVIVAPTGQMADVCARATISVDKKLREKNENPYAVSKEALLDRN